MTKQETISAVVNSYSSIFSKADVVDIIEKIDFNNVDNLKEHYELETDETDIYKVIDEIVKLKVATIVEQLKQEIYNYDIQDSIELEDESFTITYNNVIELSSFTVNESSFYRNFKIFVEETFQSLI